MMNEQSFVAQQILSFQILSILLRNLNNKFHFRSNEMAARRVRELISSSALLCYGMK